MDKKSLKEAVDLVYESELARLRAEQKNLERVRASLPESSVQSLLAFIGN